MIRVIVNGDSLAVLGGMGDGSVDMCLTSPPYWGLRDYGVEGQLGLESSPELYIERMTEIFHEVKRVLRDDGTLWLNIGDTYSANRGYQVADNKWKDVGNHMSMSVPNGMQPKCLCMIPERLAWSLIEDGWILRNKIIWYKPNAMPSSVRDRFSNKYEFIYLFAKQQKYYFDLDAVREPHQQEWGSRDRTNMKNRQIVDYGKSALTNESQNPLGKNPGDVFQIPTQPFPEAHFAVFPEKLCEKPIKAGCPLEVCRKCGKARERMSETLYSGGIVDPNKENYGRPNSGYEVKTEKGFGGTKSNRAEIKKETIGWTSCDCNADFQPGIVLDPFCGAGTVGVVAKEQGKRFIGIDIKYEYCQMAKRRIAQVGYQPNLRGV